jgi:hypothetical protein
MLKCETAKQIILSQTAAEIPGKFIPAFKSVTQAILLF